MMGSHLGWAKHLLTSLALSHSQITYNPVGKASSESTFGEQNYSNPMRQNPWEMERKTGGHCQGFKQGFIMYQQEIVASKVEGSQKIALSLTSPIPDRL